MKRIDSRSMVFALWLIGVVVFGLVNGVTAGVVCAI